MKAWHFVSDKMRDGRPVPADGEWLFHDGVVHMCRSGLHASRKLLGRIGDRLKTKTQAAHDGGAPQYAEVADQHGTADTRQFGRGRRTYADLRADARRIADHHSHHR